MKSDELQDVADVCKLLSDTTRVATVAVLAKGTRTVGKLVRELKLPQPTVSYHLALLRITGLLTRKRQGKEMHYSLNREALEPVRAFLAKLE